MRVWATAWDVFRRAPSRVGRGRRAAVDLVVCFRWGGFSSFFFCFFSGNAHDILQVRDHLALCTSLLVLLPEGGIQFSCNVARTLAKLRH